MTRQRNSAVLSPNLGLYLERPGLTVPKRGLRDCLNVRIKEQQIVRDNLGYGPFPQGAAKFITKGYIKLDNQSLSKRKGPKAAPIHSFNWKKAGK